jgi:hypothetical protein
MIQYGILNYGLEMLRRQYTRLFHVLTVRKWGDYVCNTAYEKISASERGFDS